MTFSIIVVIHETDSKGAFWQQTSDCRALNSVMFAVNSRWKLKKNQISSLLDFSLNSTAMASCFVHKFYYKATYMIFTLYGRVLYFVTFVTLGIVVV